MNCPKCGNSLNDGQKFCPNCGTNLNDLENSITKLFNSLHPLLYPIIGGICIITLALVCIGHSTKLNAKNTYNTVVEQNTKNVTYNDNTSNNDSEYIVSRKNCIYETSDGVCFTTHVFKAEPIKVNLSNEGYDFWLGAKDACETQGYKLPSDNDLRSLFSDFLGVAVKSGIDIRTSKAVHTTEIPNDYDVVKAIAPNGYMNDGSWGSVTLWEDKEFDSTKAYTRRLVLDNYGYDETYQSYNNKMYYGTLYNGFAICVHDPQGSPKESVKRYWAEKIKRDEIQKQNEREQKIENDLF